MAKTIGRTHFAPRASLIFQTSWGWVGISGTTKGLDTIVLPKSSRKAVASGLPASSDQSDDAAVSAQLRAARRQLIEFFQRKREQFEVPLDLSCGTVFQRQVWRALQRVPYGKLRSYRWVALRVGGARYARAVGNAVGANPLPIVIPCHRIVSHDASLGGFSGGLAMKRKLLTLEGTLAQLQRGRS